jgi:hypothetical protein
MPKDSLRLPGRVVMDGIQALGYLEAFLDIT